MPTRRKFLKTTALGTAGVSLFTGAAGDALSQVHTAPGSAGGSLVPRWRGFNLLAYFSARSQGERSSCMISEDDCRWIADWGFDFIRIPMDYWLWVESDCRNTGRIAKDEVMRIRESTLETVDRTVDLGAKYGLHVNLNFHRCPGYCINDNDLEPYNLWKDPEAQEAFLFHWDTFAGRYQGVSPSALSFNLVNEAPSVREGYMSRDDYVSVMSRATEVIRRYNPERPIIIDGLGVGSQTVPELIPLGLIQSVHSYTPSQISHFRASWVDRGTFPEPSWPLPGQNGGRGWDRARLEEMYAPWGELVGQGVGVHCGECGCYNRTPHDIFLAWFGDVMDIMKGYGIGYSLWEFRGDFGILDSGRSDVDYEDWYGHKLDRKLLTMLQSY